MHFHILVGTTSGNTEYLAEEVARQLNEEGHTTTLHDQPDITEVATQNAKWIACIATHGAGEYADSIFPFMQTLDEQNTELSTVQYALIGIGDSSYDTFNQAGHDAQNLFTRLGARKLCEPLMIDMLTEVDPEGVAIAWLDQWSDQRAL